MAGQIMYKVAKLGQPVKEFFTENGGFTVGDALKQAGYAVDGYELRVNGDSASESTTIRNGAVVTLVPKLKAGR